jgi:hypothetical protein
LSGRAKPGGAPSARAFRWAAAAAAAGSRSDVGGKQETPPLDGANDRLLLATVANRPAGGVDAAVQCRVRYGTAVPDTLDQLIFGDDPVCVLRKVEEQVEYLRLHVNDNAVAAPELPSIGVEQEFIELKQHFVRLSQFLSK